VFCLGQHFCCLPWPEGWTVALPEDLPVTDYPVICTAKSLCTLLRSVPSRAYRKAGLPLLLLRQAHTYVGAFEQSSDQSECIIGIQGINVAAPTGVPPPMYTALLALGKQPRQKHRTSAYLHVISFAIQAYAQARITYVTCMTNWQVPFQLVHMPQHMHVPDNQHWQHNSPGVDSIM
jgi:hypothetical protein